MAREQERDPAAHGGADDDDAALPACSPNTATASSSQSPMVAVEQIAAGTPMARIVEAEHGQARARPPIRRRRGPWCSPCRRGSRRAKGAATSPRPRLSDRRCAGAFGPSPELQELRFLLAHPKKLDDPAQKARSKAVDDAWVTILQVVPRLDAGGSELSTVEIVEALARAGATALVATEGGRLAPRHRSKQAARSSTLPVASKNPLTMLANAARLARLIKARDVSLRACAKPGAGLERAARERAAPGAPSSPPITAPMAMVGRSRPPITA